MLSPERTIAIDPTGEWGSSFGNSVAVNHPSYEVRFRIKPSDLPLFEETREMRRLRGYPMPDNVTVTTDLQEFAEGADLFVLAAKSKFFRSSYSILSPVIPYGKLIVILSKGLEKETNLRMSQIILEEDPGRIDDITVLAGPNAAKEVAAGALVGAVIAAYNPDTATKAQSWLSSNNFRMYSSDDVAGVEYGAALKNIMALGAGMADELGVEASTMAFFFTRALEEMARFGVALGAHPLTFGSLAFTGDWALSCYGGVTRNYLAGREIARRVPLSAETLEGLDSIKSAITLAEKHNISIPLISAINEVVENREDIRTIAHALMGRPLTKEQLADKGVRFGLERLTTRAIHKLGFNRFNPAVKGLLHF